MKKYDVLYLEKLIVETIISIRCLDLKPEHKKFINTNYKEIMQILDDMKKEDK